MSRGSGAVIGSWFLVSHPFSFVWENLLEQVANTVREGGYSETWA